MISRIARLIAGAVLVASLVLGLSFVSLESAGADPDDRGPGGPAPPGATQPESPQEAACQGSGGIWTDGRCMTEGDDRTVASTLRQVANILIFIVGAVSVLMAIIGGLRYAVAQGDSSAVNAAKNTVLYAVVGIVVAMAAYGIVNFVAVQLQ